MINPHPNAKRIEGRHVLEKDGTVEYEIVIVTDLPLHALDPAHDAEKVRDLLKWAHQFISMGGVANRVILMEQPQS
jgi:hypothetical protein